eukprot:4175219-Prymnesium_polylepis.1
MSSYAACTGLSPAEDDPPGAAVAPACAVACAVACVACAAACAAWAVWAFSFSFFSLVVAALAL